MVSNRTGEADIAAIGWQFGTAVHAALGFGRPSPMHCLTNPTILTVLPRSLFVEGTLRVPELLGGR